MINAVRSLSKFFLFKSLLPFLPFMFLLPRPYAIHGFAIIVILEMILLRKSLFSTLISKPLFKAVALTVVPVLVFSLFILFRFGTVEVSELYTVYGYGWFYLTSAGALLAYVQMKSDTNRKDVWIKAISSVAILFGLLGLAQFFGVLPTSSSSVNEFKHGSAVFRSTGLQPMATQFLLVGIGLLPLILNAMAWAKNTRLLLLSVVGLIIFQAALGATLGRSAMIVDFIVCWSWAAYLMIRGLPYLTKKSRLIFFCGYLLLIAFSGLVTVSWPNSMTPRIAYATQVKGFEGQRFLENQIGLDLLKKFPLGVGSKDIEQEAAKSRERLTQGTDSAEDSKVWRGVHNGYLNFSVIWGVPGILAYALALSLPLIVAVFLFRKKNWGLIQLGVYTIALLMYSLTGTVFYIETVAALGFSIYLLFLNAQNNDEEIINPGNKKIFFLLCIPVLLVGPFSSIFVSASRVAWLNSFKVQTIYFDNAGKEVVHVKVEGQDIAVPPNSTYRWNSQPTAMVHIQILDKTYDLPTKPELSNKRLAQYLVPLTDANYQLKTFKVEGDLVVMKTETLSKISPGSIYPFPVESSEEESLFCQQTPINFRHALIKDPKTGMLRPAGASSVVGRDQCQSQDQYTCWEPFWVTVRGNWNVDLCKINMDWSGYGLSVIKNNTRFIRDMM